MMATAYPFKNLVFEGGGVKGLAYIGVLEILDTYNILPQIERVAGTSAGAITATLTSFKLNAKEIRDLSNTLDFSKIPQEQAVKCKGKWTSTHPDLARVPVFNGSLSSSDGGGAAAAPDLREMQEQRS